MRQKFSLHRIYSYAIYKYGKSIEFLGNFFSNAFKIIFFDVALLFLRVHANSAVKKLELKNIKFYILVLRNKSYSKSSSQKSNEYYQLDNTIEQSGFGKPLPIIYQSFWISPLCDVQFYFKCIRLLPDFVVLSSWGSNSNHPDPKTIQLLNEKFGIRFAAIWWDTCSRNFEQLAKQYTEVVNSNVVIDNPRLLHIDRVSRFLSMWAPQDDSLFKPAHIKDIDVSFMGQIDDYRSYRANSIKYLRKSGINGFFSTEDRSAQVSHEDYASVMGRSKMVINFSQSVDGHQSKGRVMEAIRSGALLLESENNQTSELFIPGKHYISFSDEHDLLEKVQYYLIHEDKRAKIARAARSYLIKNYSNNQFWSKVIDSCASSRVDTTH
jgi:hypothetical protein